MFEGFFGAYCVVILLLMCVLSLCELKTDKSHQDILLDYTLIKDKVDLYVSTAPKPQRCHHNQRYISDLWRGRKATNPLGHTRCFPSRLNQSLQSQENLKQSYSDSVFAVETFGSVSWELKTWMKIFNDLHVDVIS